VITILVDKITPRLTYTLNFIFKDRGVDYHLENNTDQFLSSEQIQLNYSQHQLENIPSIIPSSILFENKIVFLDLVKGDFLGEDCFSINTILDPFGAIFYTLSRYEEYIVSDRDQHGRFEFENSMSSKFNWSDRVVCDRWAKKIYEFLGVDYPVNQVEIVPTFDIDNAFAYANKSNLRTNLSRLKDVIQLNKERVEERKKVLNNLLPDPYDTFGKIEGIGKQYPLTKVFWLNRSDKKYDRNVELSNSKVDELIRRLEKSVELGIHPSYHSNENEKALESEIKGLESVLKREVTISRQHFLKLDIPKTYSILCRKGIGTDYSMGFADMYGFRSGTAREHNWFDLQNETISELKIQPFAYMDGTFNDYLNLQLTKAR